MSNYGFSRKRAETKTQIGPNTVPPEEKPSTSQPDNGEASIRINKCFKEFASRRESDRFVSEGRVRINDTVALPGARVQVGDLVALDGRPVDWEHLNLLENGTGCVFTTCS
jgi:RNA-binding protein YlmH